LLLFASDLSGGPGAKLISKQQLVFDWSKQACEADDIPDLPARAFRDFTGRTQLIISHKVNRRMLGPSLDDLRHDCRVILRSSSDPDPAHFDDNEWLASVYTREGKDVYALVHEEYHGYEHPGRCSTTAAFFCWYNAVTFARSADGGDSYAQPAPPRQLVAALPYRYQPDLPPYGVFSPSNTVRNPKDGYYYALVRVFKFEAQEAGTCAMRTRDLADPASWRAWDGQGFDVGFVDPYTVSPPDPAAHVCKSVSPSEIGSMEESLTYNTYFDRFMLVGKENAESFRKAGQVDGVFFSLSSDLVHWGRRVEILEAEFPDTYKCGDPNPIQYPSLLDPSSASRNYETAGRRPYLYYTRLNYSNCVQTDDRDLVRVRLEFSK
jgi:hypothetical protein